MDDNLERDSVLSECGITRLSINAGKRITQDVIDTEKMVCMPFQVQSAPWSRSTGTPIAQAQSWHETV